MKQHGHVADRFVAAFAPARERGLKLEGVGPGAGVAVFAPARERGLKLDPSGDWRTAAANAAEAAADAKRGAGIEGDPPAPNPAALMPPAQRAAAAAAPAVNVPRRTIYALTDEEREQLRRLAE